MRLNNAVKIEKEDHARRMKVRIKKGHDYASEEDCLFNFKDRAKILDILKVDVGTSWGVALNDIILKVQRTCALLFPKPKTAENETLEDTIAIDLPNYVDLLKETLVDGGIINRPRYIYTDEMLLKEAEDEGTKSNCPLIHFGSVLVKDGTIIGRGYNYSVVPCEVCLKNKISNLEVGKNPAVCTAIHSEWMSLMNAASNYGREEIEGSTLYIVGKYPNGEYWKSKYFACTICSRFLKYYGVKNIIGIQFDSIKDMSMDEAFANSYEHLLGEKIF